MEYSIERKATITFTLNEREAGWLKGFIQNPNCHPVDEPKEDKQIRCDLFNVLKGVEE